MPVFVYWIGEVKVGIGDRSVKVAQFDLQSARMMEL